MTTPSQPPQPSTPPAPMTPEQVIASIKSAISLRLVIAGVSLVVFVTAVGLRGEGQSEKIGEMRGELAAQTKTLAEASLTLGLLKSAVGELKVRVNAGTAKRFNADQAATLKDALVRLIEGEAGRARQAEAALVREVERLRDAVQDLRRERK